MGHGMMLYGHLGVQLYIAGRKSLSLPDDVRSAPTLDKFKQCLKTHLLYSHITHSLVSVELSRTTFPLCL